MWRGARSVSWLLLAVAALLGVWVRADGLGSRPLSHDEYYFARSVERIEETGSVRFPTGGYYTRGLLPQYLTAASWSLFGKDGFGFRLPILLFSLASVAVAFAYARIWVGPGLAAAIAVALLLSSWQVEMGRFLRMYALLQLTTLLFLIAVHRSYFEGRWRLRYLPHAAVVAAALCHELAVFLCPLLFLPLVVPGRHAEWPSRASGLRFAAVGAVTTLAVVAWNWGAFYHLGVTGQYPQGYIPDFAAPIRLPAAPLWSLGAGDVIDLALLLMMMVGVAVGFALRGALGTSEGRRNLLLSTLLVAALLHQFTIVALLAILLVGRYGLKWMRRPSRAIVTVLIATATAIVGWSLMALQSAPSEGVTTVRDLLFGLPDLSPTIATWWQYLPVLATLLTSALVLVLAKRRGAPAREILFHPATFVVYVALCFGTVQPRIASLRYFFFIYPALLTVLAIATSDLAARRWKRDSGHAVAAAAFGFLALFFASEDFAPAHLADVAGAEATFCTGRFQHLRSPQGPWFCRDDVASPAAWLNERLAEVTGEPVIVASQPTASYYLRPDHAHYLRRRSTLFDAHSRSGGTIDLWSGQALVSTPRQTQSYLGDAETAWLVRAKRDRRAFPERFLFPHRLSASQVVFSGIDGRIEVVRLRLMP